MVREPFGAKCITRALYRWDSDSQEKPGSSGDLHRTGVRQSSIDKHSQPKPIYLTNGLNRPLDLSLTTEDIDGARTKKRTFTTKRCTDPLNPEYKLPSYSSSPPPVLPDPIGTIPTNFIGDIEKSQPRALHRPRGHLLDSLDVKDIAEPRRRQPKKCVIDSLDVRDINKSDSVLKPRGTNPLDPVYAVSAINGTALEGKSNTSPIFVGDIDHSKPRKLIRSISIPGKDIPLGSTPQRYVGCIPHSSVGPGVPTYEFAMPTGSRAGSLKRGIVTKRATNPLDPAYYLLDGNMDSGTRILFT